MAAAFKTLPCRPYLPTGSTADAAIVLGYALRRDGSPSKPLRERVEGGVKLYDEEAVGNLVFSGGHPGGGIRRQSEAAAMEQFAKTIAGPVRPGSWLLEDKSTSTRENAVLSLKFAEDSRWKSIVLATNPFHQLRSRLVFQCAIKEAFLPAEAPKVSKPDALCIADLYLWFGWRMWVCKERKGVSFFMSLS